MKATENLKKNIGVLMAARGWSSNKPVLAASHALGGSLSNGTLGRIRKDGENVRLNQLDELAKVFDVPVDRLLASDESLRAYDPNAGTGSFLAQAVRHLATPGAAASQLAASLADLQASRRKAIASLVAELIEAGPTVEEANAIDALAPDVTITGSPDWRHDAFELANQYPESNPDRAVVLGFLQLVDQFRANQRIAARENSREQGMSVR